MEHGYHLGGVTLKQTDQYGSCLDKLLLPYNPDVKHIKYFNYEYDESYYHLYHFERPEYVFNPGFDTGFDQTVDEPNQGPSDSPWDGLI
jgi:hypothetical protein